MKQLTPTKASHYTRRHVYYRSVVSGNLLRVVALKRHSPNWEVTLADGRQFYVDPSTRFYTGKVEG